MNNYKAAAAQMIKIVDERGVETPLLDIRFITVREFWSFDKKGHGQKQVIHENFVMRMSRDQIVSLQKGFDNFLKYLDSVTDQSEHKRLSIGENGIGFDLPQN